MLDALSYAWIVTVLVGVVLAVARNVPILEVFAARKTPAGKWASLIVGGAGLAAAAVHWWSGATIFGVEPIVLVLPVVLVYFWWTMAWRLRTAAVLFAVVLASCPSPAAAWNALGHRVIADIAWQQLDAETRQEIVDTLRRHPRYDDDFAKKAPTEGDQDRWLFGQAAVWPDMIRGNREFDHPTWHYINHPIFVGDERPVTFNRNDLPAGNPSGFNVVQAISHSQMVLASDAPPSEKAVAYCWLFHLVGDIHQPLHAVALVCDKLPEGDRGGNSIPGDQGRNLHALWDGLLGSSDKPNDVKRAVLELEKHPDWFKADATVGVPVWVAESRDLAKSSVYCPEIISTVEQTRELAPINLPEPYLMRAGEMARRRVVAASLRLAAVLHELNAAPK